MKFFEVGPNLAMTQHAITIRPLCFSGKTFRGLPPDLQAAILKAGKEAGAYGRQMGLRHSLPDVIFKGDFDTPRFAFALARKDVGLATDLAREYNVPMPMSNVAEQNMIEGMNRGWGGRDSSASFQLQEDRAGVEVRTGE